MTDSYHFPGRPGCACAVCRPYLEPQSQPDGVQAPIRSGGSDSVVTQDCNQAGPPFPPKQAKPPAHYLKGAPEPWRPWVNVDERNMGPVGAAKESFGHDGYKRG